MGRGRWEDSLLSLAATVGQNTASKCECIVLHIYARGGSAALARIRGKRGQKMGALKLSAVFTRRLTEMVEALFLHF